jgi:RHS repeat-associated protein
MVDPQLGRFLQPDPFVPEAGNPQNLNRYAYGLNNPVKHNDPSGYISNIPQELEEAQCILNS